ncbi:MAG TPA: D-alanyl-D-alanine carboxypeptidase/D-alanyl-D-alanine-endopeptidase [Jatrophihabitans sp.]|nr:D-alanyl-D-alanine carboxypeptidase/D-alanyl-D-alanine-endopeptidase [Jatrophihabitans sp.]
MTARRTANLRVVLLVILTCLLAVLGFAGTGYGRQYLADRGFHPIPVPAPTPPPAGIAPVLSAGPPSPAAAPSGPAPTPDGVSAALATGLTSPRLGPSLSGQVIDATTGHVLFSTHPDAAVAPASTSKLLAAAAILTVHKPTDRFLTRVLAGPVSGSVVLVGGGDPTLSGAPAGQPTEYPEAARISDLAGAVRRKLGATPITQVIVDDSLFSGPSVGPGWAPEDAPSSYASPITATMVDAGRDVPGAAIRSATPDLAAGSALATALGGANVALGRAPAGAPELAQVSSAPVSVLVEQMLRDSDNVIAELLARQVALAQGRPATFAGAAAAVSAVNATLGITMGSGMKDGSGLSALDRIPASALGAVLTKAVATPGLRPLLTGMSVAGWDGTLAEQDRFTGSAAIGAGTVRAKTGSLTGVSALAGVLTDSDGRQLIFDFVADRSPSEPLTRGALDALVASLVRCGCR